MASRLSQTTLAVKRREAKQERERIAARQAQAVADAKRTADQLNYRNRLVKHARAEATYDLEVALPVYERLVVGGAPPQLANAIRQLLVHTDPDNHAPIRFKESGTASYIGGPDTPVRPILEGCDVRALLEAEGFTDVAWSMNDSNSEFTPLYARQPPTWHCQFTFVKLLGDAPLQK